MSVREGPVGAEGVVVAQAVGDQRVVVADAGEVVVVADQVRKVHRADGAVVVVQNGVSGDGGNRGGGSVHGHHVQRVGNLPQTNGEVRDEGTREPANQSKDISSLPVAIMRRSLHTEMELILPL